MRTPGSRGISHCVFASRELRALPAGRDEERGIIQARIRMHISVWVLVI